MSEARKLTAADPAMPEHGGGKGGDCKERLASLASEALDLIASELRGEKQQRGARTRLITAKWVVERVLELEPTDAAVQQPTAAPRLTPEAAVAELRKRLGGK